MPAHAHNQGPVGFLIYLAVAVRDLGGRRAVLFTAWVWPVAFLAELSSTRIRIPLPLWRDPPS